MRVPDECLPPILITIHYLAALHLFFLLSCCGMSSEIATVRKIAVTHHHKSQVIRKILLALAAMIYIHNLCYV